MVNYGHIGAENGLKQLGTG